MTSSPVRIVLHDLFAAELAKELHFPHTLKTISTQSDAEIAELMLETDVFVSDIFKPAWRNDNNTTLRLIHSSGAGINSIDMDSLPKECITCNVYGHERGVAEVAFLMIFALQRSLFKLDAALRKGDWTPEPLYVPEVSRRNLLILGFGHIGRELLRWGQFLDMKITVLTRTPSKVTNEARGAFILGSLDDISNHLPEADFIVVALPADSGTIDLISDNEFGKMKPTAYVINVGRGPVINEKALYDSLSSRRIAGAGIDVWYQYPEQPSQICMPSRFPFQQLDNVIMSPHKATFETMEYRWKFISENIQRFLRKEPLRNVISRHVPA